MKIFIKIGVPSWSETPSWGDYHFARAMQRALSGMGHEVVVQILPEWDDDSDRDSDVTIHLMGLSRYKAKKGPLNVLWLISHPDKISSINFSQYDLVFAASRPLAKKLKSLLGVPVVELLQFADTYHMFPDYTAELEHELTFVGNSRGEKRKIIKDILPCEYNLKIWGGGWEAFLPEGYVEGTYFPYSQLRRLYSSSLIVLNDHWEDMRRWGLVNNRIFDALACKGFVVSDANSEMARIFPEAVVSYLERKDLIEKIEYYLEHPQETEAKRELGYKLVKKHHSAEIRMQEMVEALISPPSGSRVKNFVWQARRRLLKKRCFNPDSR